MGDKPKSISDIIKENVISDYFTPSIRAEVIFDMLLTPKPYIEDLINGQIRDENGNPIKAKFLAKEMSIEEDGSVNNSGKKIDYVLEDSEFVYFVELKTTNGSMNQKQWNAYKDNCKGVKIDKKTGKYPLKSFGEVAGNRLIKIICDEFGKTFRKTFLGENADGWNNDKYNELKSEWSFKKLQKAFSDVFTGSYYSKEDKSPIFGFASKAKELIFKEKWAVASEMHSKKYLYTMGQILDNHERYKQTKPDLWDKKVKLIYITPNGKVPPNAEAADNPAYSSFYMQPGEYEGENLKSVSLYYLVKNLEAKNKKTAYDEMIINIIKEIFAETKKEDK